MAGKHSKAQDIVLEDIAESKETGGFGKQLLRYTLLFVITAVCTYALFIVLPRTFLSNADGNVDGIAQHYPIYSEIKRLIHALIAGGSWQNWSWDIGLGDSTFLTFNTKLLNPLTYIVTAFPQKYLDVGFTLMVLISQYLSGLSFMLLGRKTGLDYRQNITGGLCYAFSGWAIQAILRQGTFLMALILFPLLVLGFEKILRKESPLVFILTVAAHVIYSIQWAYASAIGIVLYFFIRLITYKSSEQADRVPQGVIRTFFASGIAGILTGGIVLAGNLFKILGTTVSSTVEDPVLYPLSWYLEIPAGFFQTTPTTNAYTVIGLPVICVILLPLAAARIRKKDAGAIMMVLLFLLSLLPFTGRVFNGFSYSVGRWYYMLVFFMVWTAVKCYKPETFRIKKNIAAMTIWLVVLAVWTIGFCWYYLKIIPLHKAAAAAIGLVTGISLIMLLARDSLGKGGKRGLLMTAIIIISIVGYVNTNLFPKLGEQIHTLCQVGRIESDFSSSTQRVGPALQAEDESFYRIDQVDGYTDARIARVRANENMYFGNRSIYSYLSTMDSGWLLFNKTVGNNAGYFDRTTSYSNDNREGLDLLMGVKYFLGDSDNKKPGANRYAAYGYEPFETIDGVEILQNKYCIGLGTSFSSYITQSELEGYAPLEREQILLQTAVVPDSEAEKLGDRMHHAIPEELRTDIFATEVEIADPENVDVDEEGKSLTVHKDGHFTIKLPEIEDVRVVLAFEGFTRDECDLDTELSLEGKKFKGNALSKKVKTMSFIDDQKFKIEVTDGDLVKAAQMRKGKNQGLSDVEDFYINLGYYEKLPSTVRVDIDRVGEYYYEDIKAYIVPMDLYDETAPVLEKNSLQISEFSGGKVTGTMTSEEDSVMYFSVLEDKGWDIYVDGKLLGEEDRIRNVDIAFTGAVLPAGEHDIVMEYHTPYMKEGLIMTAAGILLTVIILIWHAAAKRRRAGNI